LTLPMRNAWPVARSYRCVDRDQQFLLPPDMSEWLAADHPVWFFIDVVSELDTAVFHRRHPTAGPGRRAYDPEMLLALLLYSYAVGQRSSRRIEALCVTDVAFRVLCAQDAPDHTTIARFRARHEDAFADLFTQVLVLCARAGMGQLETVAIDGTKIAANAARGANRTEETLRAEAERIIAEAAAVDSAEDERFGELRGDELPKEFAGRHGRRDRIRQALEEIAKERAETDRLVDSERVRAEEYMRRLEAGELPRGVVPKGVDRERVERARLKIARQRCEQAPTRQLRYDAVKMVRDAQRKLAAAQAAAVGADAEPGHGGADGRGRVTKHTQRKLDKALRANTTDPDSRLMTDADGGSIQGYNAQIAVSGDHLILATQLTQDANDVTAFEPMMDAAVAAAERVRAVQPPPEADEERPTGIAAIVADAGYLSGHNLTVEGPDRLIALGKNRELHRDAREHPASGPPPEDATPIEQMRHRLRTPEGVKTYKRRGATVEPINAHLKDQVGLRRFSRRGLKAAASELHLAAAVVNLLKLQSRMTPATS
jgi:transposase